jgi:hypothetical protein
MTAKLRHDDLLRALRFLEFLTFLVGNPIVSLGLAGLMLWLPRGLIIDQVIADQATGTAWAENPVKTVPKRTAEPAKLVRPNRRKEAARQHTNTLRVTHFNCVYAAPLVFRRIF